MMAILNTVAAVVLGAPIAALLLAIMAEGAEDGR